jgi:Spy/CpxP family protein refolding chaperone
MVAEETPMNKPCSRLIFLTVLLLAAVAAQAQQVSDETMLTYQVLTEEWDKMIGGVLELDEKQAAAFWPLYKEYRAARSALMQERSDVIKMFLSGYDTMDAKYSRELLDAAFEIDEKILKVKREYAPRFDKVLPPVKVVRLYQTENKLEVMMMAELTKDVPLAR